MALWRGEDLVFEMVNPEYQAIFGTRELLGRPFLEAVPEFVDQPFADLIRKVLTTGEPFVGHEVLARLRRSPEGPLEDRYYDFTYVRLEDLEGKPYGVYDHAIDVTDRVTNRRELKSKQDQLTATIQDLEQERDLRDQFVSALTHDLRTPLTAAKMSAQIIQRTPDQPEKVQSLAGRINMNMERVDQMIRDLLDVGRIRAGHPLALRTVYCDLIPVVSTTLDDLATVHGNRFFRQGDRQVSGFWDCDAIKRLVENLCNNAIKYGDPHRAVTVTVKAKDGAVSITVHNEGNPIPEEMQKNLFHYLQRSWQAEASGKRGWGIGLTLVRGVAEAHGGTVAVASSAEKGTDFEVVLPRDMRLLK
jgi:signal transduction histidine kinase